MNNLNAEYFLCSSFFNDGLDFTFYKLTDRAKQKNMSEEINIL